MKIVLAGGSGQVGTLLARHYHAQGHDVVVLSRRPAAAPWRTTHWDAETLGAWAQELEGADAVFGLAGRSVNCRYTPENKRLIMDSRVNSTRVLGQAIAQAHDAPRVWIQASTATIYGHSYTRPNNEDGELGGEESDAPPAWRFSIDVAKAWEQAANEAETSRTRKIITRTALTLSPDRGGIFDTLLSLVRRGLGGKVASGRQMVSWLHDADYIAAVDWLIAHEHMSGIVNLAVPHPLPMDDFMRELRRAWDIPFGLPSTRWMLEIASLFMQTETELILKSRYVLPGRLLAEGFAFQYPQWPAAADDLCQRWRA
ncbi:MAG: TIGR01777 family oxidoreductase [Anaerolineales bacterium]|nr:TIGR01777 family oxidoreductase [Anaerolineales bacterium]